MPATEIDADDNRVRIPEDVVDVQVSEGLPLHWAYVAVDDAVYVSRDEDRLRDEFNPDHVWTALAWTRQVAKMPPQLFSDDLPGGVDVFDFGDTIEWRPVADDIWKVQSV